MLSGQLIQAIGIGCGYLLFGMPLAAGVFCRLYRCKYISESCSYRHQLLGGLIDVKQFVLQAAGAVSDEDERLRNRVLERIQKALKKDRKR
jgi:hypothetical protein